ncbi:hypothetical protein GY45DRAFT_1315408 [Cubamyces sp. BRFM 1775]|nr:hypothetical protein GY45DRAFT_1315408 [Cubamyces sp. BRFM 1775]
MESVACWDSLPPSPFWVICLPCAAALSGLWGTNEGRRPGTRGGRMPCGEKEAGCDGWRSERSDECACAMDVVSAARPSSDGVVLKRGKTGQADATEQTASQCDSAGALGRGARGV